MVKRRLPIGPVADVGSVDPDLVFASRLLRACRMRSVATSPCSCSPVIQLGDVSFDVLKARRHAQKLVGEQRAQQQPLCGGVGAELLDDSGYQRFRIKLLLADGFRCHGRALRVDRREHADRSRDPAAGAPARRRCCSRPAT